MARSRSTQKNVQEEKMEDKLWYHGLLPRKEITEVLMNNGDWLVRCTEKHGKEKFVISVKWRGEFRHIMLNQTEKGWVMPDRNYQTVPQLIAAYQRHKKPLNDRGPTLAGKPVPRPKYMIPKRQVERHEKLGCGAFGEVYGGTWTRKENHKIPVALKTCKVLKHTKDREDFLEEAKKMLHYKHKNVVRLFGVVADRPPLMLVMEHCPGGSLLKHLRNRRGALEEKDKIRYSLEAVRGLEYLGVSKNCVHRDLAARNCLIGRNGEIKLSDFGLSRQGDYIASNPAKMRLPILWTAPEALTKAEFSQASDVWSFGVLMREIFTDGETPWPGHTRKEALAAMKEGKKMSIPPTVPQDAQDVMKRCWEAKPQDRPSTSRIRHQLEIMAGLNPTPLSSSISIDENTQKTFQL